MPPLFFLYLSLPYVSKCLIFSFLFTVISNPGPSQCDGRFGRWKLKKDSSKPQEAGLEPDVVKKKQAKGTLTTISLKF